MKTPIATHRQKGFSLIEVIISLLIVGIMSVVVYSYMGNSLTNSTYPIIWLNDAQTLNAVMERIKTDYDQEFESSPTSPWIYNFFETTIKDSDQAPYISDVDSIETQLGTFNASNAWEDCAPDAEDCPYLKVTLTKGIQTLRAVFSE
jgi:prepilin-type N-terminal cleavage/methylation domain-containing protein